LKPWSFLHEDLVKAAENAVKNNSLETVHEKSGENDSSRQISSKINLNSIDPHEHSDTFVIKDRISFEI
jgi:hypothetical protein